MWQALVQNDPARAAAIANGPISKDFKGGTTNAKAGIFPGGTLGATIADRSVVFFRPGGIFGSGGIGSTTILHEALHSVTGLGDTRLAQLLGVTGSSDSRAITDALQQHHCIGD